MPSGFTALPAELKIKIFELLVPYICKPDAFPADARTIADDLERIFHTCRMRPIRALAMTCKDLQEFCRNLFFRVIKLDFDNDRVKVKVLDDGSLPAPFRSTLFLSLEGCKKWSRSAARAASGDSEDMETDADAASEHSGSSEDKPPPPLELDDICLSELDYSIAAVFQHFSSVTTLDLENFSLSLTGLCSLHHLKALRTLSIRAPDTRYERLPNVHRLKNAYRFPQVSALSVAIYEIDEAFPISNVVKLFEKSIEMFSIMSHDYGDDGDSDFLKTILFNDVNDVKLEGLKHLNIDLLPYSANVLRKVVSRSSVLESMCIDCRGSPGFLPFFYVIDLIRLATREEFDSSVMVKYDSQETHSDDEDDEMDDGSIPYITDGKIATARLGRFSCKFTTVRTKGGTRRVLDTLDVYFATEDEHLELINIDIRVSDLARVFRSRKSTFSALRSLVIATESKYPPETEVVETLAELKQTAESLATEYLPSVERITVRWHNNEQFSWVATKGEAVTDDGMDVDPLWTL